MPRTRARLDRMRLNQEARPLLELSNWRRVPARERQRLASYPKRLPILTIGHCSPPLLLALLLRQLRPRPRPRPRRQVPKSVIRSRAVPFRLAPDGTERVLHNFLGGNDGSHPSSRLLRTKAGNLYGTTQNGGGGTGCGRYGCGTVFKRAPDGTETILHAFQKTTDGAVPRSALIADKSGYLYGTTSQGGNNSNCRDDPGSGCGTVFKLKK